MEGEILRPRIISRGERVFGCPRCSTVYWNVNGEIQEFCTQCGGTGLVDADELFWDREDKLKAAMESLNAQCHKAETAIGRTGESTSERTKKRMDKKRQQKMNEYQQRYFQAMQQVFMSGIAPGPLSWYICEQHDVLIRLGRTLTFSEAQDRINAMAQQNQAAQQAAYHRQMEGEATLAFISMSSQLRTIERNTGDRSGGGDEANDGRIPP